VNFGSFYGSQRTFLGNSGGSDRKRALGAFYALAYLVASATDNPSFHSRRLNDYDSVRVLGEYHPCGLNALSQADSGVVPAFQRNVMAAGDCRRREAPPQGRQGYGVAV